MWLKVWTLLCPLTFFIHQSAQKSFLPCSPTAITSIGYTQEGPLTHVVFDYSILDYFYHHHHHYYYFLCNTTHLSSYSATFQFFVLQHTVPPFHIIFFHKTQGNFDKYIINQNVYMYYPCLLIWLSSQWCHFLPDIDWTCFSSLFWWISTTGFDLWKAGIATPRGAISSFSGLNSAECV